MRNGWARIGEEWTGPEGKGKAWFKSFHGRGWTGGERRGRDWRGLDRIGMERRGMAWFKCFSGVVRVGKVRLGRAGQGMVLNLFMAWSGVEGTG